MATDGPAETMAGMREQATGSRAWLAVLLTTAMALSMLPLFLLGALGPYVVGPLGIGAPLLGVLVSVGFAVAAVLSLFAGPAVTAIGPRRCLVALFGVSAAALALFAVAPGYGLLVLAVAASGLPQALANPATNQLIATRVPAVRRGGLTGIKQSGVQLGAFLAGLPLAAVAAAADWRVAVGIAAGGALVAALATFGVPADARPARLPSLSAVCPRGDALWLSGFSVLLGAGISAINTYVALFATRQLGTPVALGSALIAVLGVAGIFGRVLWSRRAARRGSPGALLAPLALGAAASALALGASALFGTWWVWAGVLGIGACAVAANAVSMVTVIATVRPEFIGRDSAVVSAGFFTGFAIGPLLMGSLVQAAGDRFEGGWLLVSLEFLGAAAVAWLWRRRTVQRA
jgi:predicted MFS family arabinose efflux permease